ncbi:MAG: hypothetical protein RQ715_07740 [Methylococcales bacterium]|nr:hypothetical protein [Methylococcales bacterium]
MAASWHSVKIPGPMRYIWASLGALWLADIINTGFFVVATLLLGFIPVLWAEQAQRPQSRPDNDKDS